LRTDHLAYRLFILDGAWVLTALIDVAFEEFLIPYTKRSKSKLDDQLVNYTLTLVERPGSTSI
jgi:hypothetical protein